MHIQRQMLLYCGVALANILATLVPIWPMRYELLASTVPQPLIQGSDFVTLALGVTMLILAAPVAGGHLKAAYLLMLSAAIAVLANIFKGLDVGAALLNATLLMALWRSRARFDNVPLRYTPVDVARLALALIVFLWLYDLSGEALFDVLLRVVERETDALPQLGGLIYVLTAKLQLQQLWFRESQLILPMSLSLVFLIFSWRSVMRIHNSDNVSEDLYERFGRASHNSLAYLARRSDVSRFVDPKAGGAITYRQIGRIAVQIGAILAPPERREQVYRAFLAFCREQHLIPSAAAITTDEREVVHACGMNTLNIGTEAVVDLSCFSLQNLSKKMRWAQRSLTKRGYSVSLLGAAAISPPMQVALDRIDEEWRLARGGRSHGCCMTLGRFPAPSDADCLIAVAANESGMPVAYLTLLPGGPGYYSLDLTRRLQCAPNAIMEFLLLEVLSNLREQAVTTVSLNFSTFSSFSSVRGIRGLMLTLDKAIQLGSLEAFNAKFRPTWVPRYLVVPSWYYLPDVAYAILALEGVDRMLTNALVRRWRRASKRMPAAATFRSQLLSD
jgi:lysyl-tRNA synthetase class 2